MVCYLRYGQRMLCAQLGKFTENFSDLTRIWFIYLSRLVSFILYDQRSTVQKASFIHSLLPAGGLTQEYSSVLGR